MGTTIVGILIASLCFWVVFGWCGGARGQWACMRQPGKAGWVRSWGAEGWGAEVGRSGKAGAEGAAWGERRGGLWMREHTAHLRRGERPWYRPVEVLREPLVACCAHLVADRAVARSRAVGDITDISLRTVQGWVQV